MVVVATVEVRLLSVLNGPWVEMVPLGLAVPPVLIGPPVVVELAKGGEDVVELPPEPVLRLTPVPELGPGVPVDIGPTVTVEFKVVVESPAEERRERGGKEKT